MLCREGPPNERAAGREIVAFTCSHFHKLLHPPTRLRFMHTFEALINDTHCREKKRSTRIVSCSKCIWPSVTKSNILYSVGTIS